MNAHELHDELKTLVAEVIEIDEFGDNDNFVSDLGVDSMLALEIVARIEKRYRIRVPEERFLELQTLNSAVNVITELLEQQAVKS